MEPTIRIRLENSDFWDKSGNAAGVAWFVHSEHSACYWKGQIMALPSIPQYENPDSSPFDIVPRSWEKLRFISDGFLCWKLHHLFIFWPLNAAANAKSFSIFERNYKFPFYLMSCKPWFGKISVENESRIIWFRARGLKEEIGLWQLWNMLEIFQFRWIGVACEELGPNRWEKGVWQIKSSQTQTPHISLNIRSLYVKDSQV